MKALIPAAGLGTRFLPATKCTPKELLPVLDKPVIQYVVEEALEPDDVDGVVIVASPQDLVATIVGKAVNMAKSMDVPVLGLVENMSYFECPDCGKKHYIFGDSHIDEVAEKYGVDVLARLPMNPDFAAMCDEGKVMDIPNPGIDAEKLLDKAASVKIASSLMGGWTVAE